MTASELRALAEKLKLVDPLFPGDYDNIAAAAEVLELVAWAEENKRCPQYEARVKRPAYWSVMYCGDQFHGDTLIDTLRRAREAAR